MWQRKAPYDRTNGNMWLAVTGAHLVAGTEFLVKNGL